MSDRKYTAFISYRHKTPDEAVAKRLHSLIENFRIPGKVKRSSGKKRMGTVFRDQEELPLSKDLGADIRTALDNSEWLIVLCSPDYLESQWCQAELDYFISIGKRDRILTVLVKGEPYEAFPEQLTHDTDGDGVREIEPLAADVRADSVAASLRKLSREKLRILAPMLGVSFDDLRQRARRRKTRVIAAVTAAGFAAMAAFLIYSISMNDRIATQRDLAMDNQMQLLIGQANMSVSDGDKIPAAVALREAIALRENVGGKNDVQLRSAMEYALYNDDFETVLTLKNNNRHFESLVFSYNDKYLLGISNQNSANLIDASTGEVLFTVARSDVGQLSSVGFTRDDRYFYTVDSWYGFVSLYEVSTGKLYRQYDEGSDTAWMIGSDAFAIDGGKLIIPKQKTLLVWDYEADTYDEILQASDQGFDEYNQAIGGYLALSPGAKRIAYGSSGYGTGMWVADLSDLSKVTLERDDSRGYMRLCFSSDGSRIAASSGNMCFVWDANTGKRLFGAETGLADHVALNNDGTIMLASGMGALAAYDTASGKKLWETAEKDSASDVTICVSPDGSYVCAGGGLNGIYDTRTGKKISDCSGAAFSHDSSRLLSNPYNGTPQLMITPEYSTQKRLDSFDKTLFTTARWTDPSSSPMLYLRHNAGEFYTTMPEAANRQARMYISPDTKYAAYTNYDGFIEVFDITDPSAPKDLSCVAEHCYYSVTDLLFNGTLMASCGGYDPRCVLFDLEKGDIAHVLMGTEYMHKCEFSKDGSKIILLCGMSRNTALVYSTATGNLLYRFDAAEGQSFEDVGFTEDGSMVAAVESGGGAVVGNLYPTLDDMIKALKNR